MKRYAWVRERKKERGIISTCCMIAKLEKGEFVAKRFVLQKSVLSPNRFFGIHFPPLTTPLGPYGTPKVPKNSLPIGKRESKN
jgi:hypothetical protein